jgi:Bacterial PH domain
MAPDDRAGLTASDVDRWLRGLQLFHAARFAVMAAVIGATVVSAVVQSECTPDNPCGPSLQGAWWLALLFASLVLLMFAPGLGCLSALTLGVLGVGYDPALGARGWWAAEAALSAAALIFLLLIRVHQYRVAATIARRITLPGGRTGTAATWGGLRAQFRSSDERPGLIGWAAAAGLVLLIIDHYQRVELPLLSFASLLGLVAGPDDQKPWLSFAILALLLAAAATLRPARVLWAHRRPVGGDLRGILVSTRWPDPYANAEISAADGSGLRLTILKSPVPARDKDWTQPEMVVVTGQLWYGGVVQLYALDGEALADAIMGLPQYTFLRSWAKPAWSNFHETFIFEGEPADSPARMVVDGQGLVVAPALTPFTTHKPNRHPNRRLIGWILWPVSAVAMGTVGLAVAFFTPGDPGLRGDLWYAFCVLGALLLWLLPAMAMRELVHAHVEVSEDGVTVVNSWSTYRIPWSAIDKVELGPTGYGPFQLVFTTPDEVITAVMPVGLASPTGGMVELMNRIVTYRDRTRVTDGHPATAVKVTGAAAYRRRARPPVSDSPLPPVDIAGHEQDE